MGKYLKIWQSSQQCEDRGSVTMNGLSVRGSFF